MTRKRAERELAMVESKMGEWFRDGCVYEKEVAGEILTMIGVRRAYGISPVKINEMVRSRLRECVEARGEILSLLEAQQA